MYTFLAEDNHESKKAKGINKNVVDNELKCGDYKNYLLNKSYMRHKMNGIQSENHNIGSCSISKISFSSQYDKKYILKEGYSRTEGRQFLLIFALVRTAILRKIISPCYKKLNFSFNKIMEDYSPKQKIKKIQKQKSITKPINETSKKILRVLQKSSQDEIMQTIEIKMEIDGDGYLFSNTFQAYNKKARILNILNFQAS